MVVSSNGSVTGDWQLTNPLDLSSTMSQGEGCDRGDHDGRHGGQYDFDSFGAMDLSSSCSSSIKAASSEEEMDGDELPSENKKRKADDDSMGQIKNKRGRKDESGEAGSSVKNRRRNIKDVMIEDKLEVATKAAKAEEEERLNRLKEQKKQLVIEAYRSQYEAGFNGEQSNNEVVNHESSGDDEKTEDIVINSDSDECKVVDDDIDEQDDYEEDPQNSGMHVNDALNIRNSEGEVLVNVGHPEVDDDIFLAPQLASAIKPHQIGGVRFLYDNVVESVSRYSQSPGFGCILAHSMGLGKTMQIVSFIDIFLSHTPAKKVLCIVPINTIQNWLAEFNYWLPAKGESSRISENGTDVKNREFPIHVLNDSLKNLPQRAAVIASWHEVGGVLLMGYELYRQLANKKPRKRKVKGNGMECIDLEEEDKNRIILNDIQKALVNPGPDLAVCDEGHRIKNSHASISQALKQIKTRRRVVLTGYPLQNNLMEYWCMVDFVRPNFLGNKTEFSNMFERPIQNGQCIDSTPKDVRLMKHRAHVLHEQLKGFVQRRGQGVLKTSLPEKTEHVLFVRMTEVQRRLYKRFMEELITNRCVSNPLKAFAVCCKIWNHPDVLYNFLRKKEEIDIDFDPEESVLTMTPGAKVGKEDEEASSIPFGKKEEINYEWAQGMLTDYVPELETSSNKLQIFLGILNESLVVGDRILLFSQSLFTLNLIEEFLGRQKTKNVEDSWKQGVNYFRLDGSTSALEREKLINEFNINTKVKLFLVSTRAGSLGVNLVGANRVIIFDASWNPCHDTQAVCRVYRYGQVKPTHVYRLVSDNSLEKKIYDRQVNKQGMADRIVDELNPDAHLSSKEVHSLICDEEEDPPVLDMTHDMATFQDPVMKNILSRFGQLLTKTPFAHESLLVDRKDNKLSRAEKKLAERAYKLERTSKITYSRPSYAAFYPKQGKFATNLHNPGSNGYTRNRYYEHGKRLDSWVPPTPTPAPIRPVASVKPIQQSHADFPGAALQLNEHLSGPKSSAMHVDAAFPTPMFSNVLTAPPEKPVYSGTEWTQRSPPVGRPNDISKIGSIVKTTAQIESSKGLNTASALEVLSRQGVGLQQVTVPRDLVIPTGQDSAPISLTQGQTVMVIKTPKGIYLRMEEKIIKIKQPGAVQGLLEAGEGYRNGQGRGSSNDGNTGPWSNIARC